MRTVKYTDFNLYARLLRQARPYWPHLIGLFLLSLLSTPLALLTPLPLKIIVDSAIGTQPLPGIFSTLPVSSTSAEGILILGVVLVVMLALLGQFQKLGGSLLRTYTGERLVLDFRARLFQHVQRLSFAYHDARGTADSVYRIQYDSPAIQHITIDGISPFVTAIFTLAAMVYITAQLDWQLALVALGVSPPLFLVSRAYRRRLRQQSREAKQLQSASLAVVQEVLTALRVVKAFGQEDREQERFVHHAGVSLRSQLRLAVMEGGFGLLVGLTTAVGTALVLYIGVRHVQSGLLTLGELLLVMSYLSQLYGPLEAIGRKAASLQSHLASAERALALLDEAPDVPEQPNARPLAHAAGAITFREVQFAYNPDRTVLKGISFEVGIGARVGIAGRTGAGKTTLISLLTRFYDPTAGAILLDGVDLREYKLADLRNQFSIVLQEPVLFSTSIGENIAYARPDATEEEIVAAAKAANAHDFIMDLPEGYQTRVGERGMRLSGGERQRISLARAFLKDAPILILDEPTSSVDLKTEATIMEALERLMAGRTTFMIAHRLSTLANCDVRLRLEQGRLVQEALAASASEGQTPMASRSLTAIDGGNRDV